MKRSSSPVRMRAHLKSGAALAVLVVVAAFSSGLLRGAIPAGQTGQWVVTGDLSVPRARAAAALLATGDVLVTGGSDGSGSLASVERFRSDGGFEAAAPMNEARAEHTAVALPGGGVLVAGGRYGAGAIASIEIFDDGAWTMVAMLTDARWGHTTTLLKDGRVLIAGGENASGAVMSVELFDPSSGVVTVAGTMASPRKGHAAALLNDGRVLITGGATDHAVLATTEIFDPELLQFSSGPSLNTARWGLTATTLLDGRVVFIGGYDGTQNVASAEIYSDVTNAITFTATTTPMVARRNHQAFLLPNNNAVLIVGGVAEAMVDGVLAARETSAAELYLPWINEVWQTGGMTSARTIATGAALSIETYGAVPAGEGLLMVSGGDGQSSSEAYRFATIRTDKDDYAPGEQVFVSGTGWQPNESVTFALRELPAEHASRLFTITADELGGIRDAFLFDVEEHHLDVKFLLTARGAASQAQVAFRDSNPQNITVTPNSQTITQGGVATYGTVKVGKGGNNNACQITLGITASTGTGLPAGAIAAFDQNPVTMTSSDVTTSLGVTTSSTTPTGTFTFRVTGTNSGSGCQGPGPAPSDFVTLIVQAGARATTTIANSSAATYGQSAVDLSATVTPDTGAPVSDGTVTFSIKDGSATVGTVTSGTVVTGAAAASFPLSGLDAGTYAIEAVYNAGSGFTASNNSAQSPAPTLTVSPRLVTGSFTANDKSYDGTTSATIATRSVSDVLGGDAPNVSLTGGTAAFSDPAVGNGKSVTATGFSLAGSAAANYTLGDVTSWTNTASITAVALTPSVTVDNKTYDGTTAATIGGRTFTDADAIAPEDDVTLGGGSASFADKTVGQGKTVNITGLTLSGADASNYVLATSIATATADITPRAITVTADAKTKPYGDSDPALTHQLTSGTLVAGDSLTGELTRASGENVGTFAIQQGTLTAGGNYQLSFVGANLTISARAITVTADAKTKAYGDADPALTYQLTTGSLVDGDSLNGELTRDPGENVGTYPIQQGTLSAGGNYDLAFVGTNLTIASRAVTATADPQSKHYGDADPVLTYQVTQGSLAGSDAFAGTLTRVAGENVGAYAIEQGTLSLGSNYELTFVGASLTVAPRAITVTAEPKSKPYGDPDPELTYVISSGSLHGTDAFTGDLIRATGENVGAYAIEQGTLALGSNYELTFSPADLTITKRAITAAAEPKSKVYGEVDPALTYQVTSGSLAFSDAFSGALTRAAGENVGAYAIEQGTLALGSNYELTFSPADLTITKRAVTITADAKSKVYGEADPALTYQVTSGRLAFSDAFSGALTRAAGEDVGTYAIGQGTVTLTDNYELTFSPADLTITKRAVTITADAKSKVYGEADPALTYQVASGSLAFSDAFSGALTRAAGEDVGTYAIGQGTVTLTDNYELTFNPANLTITARPVTVTVTAGQTKVYGEAEPALTYAITSGNLVNSDTFTGEVVREAGDNVGSYAIGQGTLALSGNYTLTFVGGTFTITKRAVTITADAKSKTYGEADPALSYQVTSGSLAFSDAFTGALTRAAGENVGVYAIGQGTVTLTDNYELTFSPADLTITKRAVTITADAKSKVYGEADPALTYQVTSGSLAFSDAFTGALTRAAGENVGAYAIGQGTVALSANYTLSFIGADLTITKRPVTVTADAKQKLLNAPDPMLTYQITTGNLVNGDSFAGALTRAAGEAIGTYSIQQGTLALSANYQLTYVGADLKVIYRWDGFLQPITNTAHDQHLTAAYSTFKAGQTIPVKFELKDAAGNIVMQAGNPVFTRTATLGACASPEVPEDLIGAVAPDSDGVYKVTGTQYHYGWSTKSIKPGLYLVFASLADGTQRSAAICLTK